ncbi:MAG: tetratricopeptide repeat protein [Bacteroidota bacterium]
MGLRSLRPAALSLVLLIFPSTAMGQEIKENHPNSSVFRDYKSPDRNELIRPSDATYQFWEGLLLMRRANSGDPVAQEELGYRYFLGKGFSADTARAAYWIGKAADQNMPIAQYNLGVFLNNGWAVPWNPFKAYERFKAAAEDSLPEGEFAYGLFFTDNLVVPRDWPRAYRWVKLAGDAKYEPAQKVIAEFIRRGIPLSPDTTGGRTTPTHDSVSAGAVRSIEPLYLDYGPDTTSHVDDLTLLNEAFREGNDKFREALGVSHIFDKETEKDTTALSVIESAAGAGSPEALTVLGRCYERGAGVPRDRILAAEQYLQAARMDSRHGLALLLQLVRENGFAGEVESRAKAGDDDAAFVWAGLTELELDHRLLDDQALNLLVAAANHNHLPSLIEVGRCYYTGQWTARNPAAGAKYWRRAAEDGSRDAEIRLAAAAVVSDSNGADSTLADSIRILLTGSGDGSTIAQLALGYCYENGVGVAQNTPQAVRLYRNCAQRGSESAYNALKRMYDKLRPKGREFDVDSAKDVGD